MGKFNTFLAENDSPWREDPDLRYIHDHMGKDFLKLLVKYEDDGLNSIPLRLWSQAAIVLMNKLKDVGELENMEPDEMLAYASSQLSSALYNYVNGKIDGCV
jgi:hypothetical protein